MLYTIFTKKAIRFLKCTRNAQFYLRTLCINEKLHKKEYSTIELNCQQDKIYKDFMNHEPLFGINHSLHICG